MRASMALAQVDPLSDRWTPLRHHAVQRKLATTDARFRVVPAGRRSGKTEISKRFIVKEACAFWKFPDGNFVCAAPTHQQARRIFWSDLKSMVPRSLLMQKPRESDLTLKLYNGTTIYVAGMDAPERIEGMPIDGLIFDEYGNAKPESWTQHLRPALSTPGRLGWAWLIGVPEGRNHYYDLYQYALKDTSGDWEAFDWFSADIIDPEEVEAAKREMDEQTYRQEFEGKFVTFEGRVYYGFSAATHATRSLKYNPTKDLIFAFDFNNAPGVCAVIQELDNPIIKGKKTRKFKKVPATFSGVIGEVHIPRNSNTELVCRKLIQDWKHHKGDVLLYGDPAGGAKTSQAVEGSDWDIIRAHLRPTFGRRLSYRYDRSAPKIRVRVNAMNSRILAADGTISFLVDPDKAPNVVKDFEGVRFVKGAAAFEVDKKSDPGITHLSDAIGYFVHRAHSISGKRVGITYA